MNEGLVRVALFVAVCLAAGLVQGATRATEPHAILRQSVRAFVSLAGGIALLCVGIGALLLITQG